MTSRKNAWLGPCVRCREDDEIVDGIVESDVGPLCAEHAAQHVGLGPANKHACRGCRKRIDGVPLRFGDQWWHEECLRDEIMRLGCPKHQQPLKKDGWCYTCGFNRLEKILKQAESDAGASVGAAGELCSICLAFNAATSVGLPFYPSEPQPASVHCTSCERPICERHTAFLPKNNVLKLPTNQPYCSGSWVSSCVTDLEKKVACGFEDCETTSGTYDIDNKDWDPLTQTKKCKKCGAFYCNEVHGHDACPECEGYKCERCDRRLPKDSLNQHQTDSYSFESLCDDCTSEAESDDETSSWSDWARRDFERAVAAHLEIEPDFVDEADLDSDALLDLFRDKGGALRYNDSNVQETAERVVFSDLEPLGVTNERLADWRWANGTRDDFEEALAQTFELGDRVASDDVLRELLRLGESRVPDDADLGGVAAALTQDEIDTAFGPKKANSRSRRRPR